MADVNLSMAVLVVILSAFIPGVLIALPLLKRTKTSLVEIALFGMILGIVIPPLMMFLLSFIGINFSIELVFGTIVLVTILGLLWNIKEKSFPSTITVGLKDVSWVLLILILLISFYVRLQSFGPTFFEFDPYFYQYTTKFILTEGYVPVVDTTAWYPNLYTHRGGMPLMNYLVAEWYTLTLGTLSYDNYALSSLSGIYPPLVGALLAFAIFVLLKEENGQWFGVLGAAFAGFIPVLVQKFAAGEMEIQPWGIFASFFFFAALALAVNRDSRRYAVLAGVAYLATAFGSAYTIVITLVYAAYMGLISSAIFLLQKEYEKTKLHNFEFLHNKALRRLVEINAIILLFVSFAYIVETSYHQPTYMTLYKTYDYLQPYLLTVVAVFLYLVVLYLAAPISEYVSNLLGAGKKYSVFDVESKGLYIGAIILLGIVLIFITPVGAKVLSFVGSATVFAGTQSTVGATVAEENLLSVNQLANQIEGSVGGLGGLIKIIIGIALAFVSGLPPQAQTVVVYFAIFSPFMLAAAYSAYKGSKVSPLIAIIVLPLAYVGVNKIKFVLHLGLVIGISFVSALGGIGKAVGGLSKSAGVKEIRYVPLVFCALIALFQFYPIHIFLGFNGYSNVGDVLITSISPQFRTGGVVDCNKLYEDHIKTRYSKGLSINLHCNKIPQVWLNVMEWINKNTEPGSRVISWWDYGHWTNFFGDRNTVTRGEHPYEIMDQEVANAFTNSPPEKLAQYMRSRDSRYALFDFELVFGGGGDGKWGALNFLSCSYNNQTSVSKGVGTSACEYEHRYEYVYIPITPDINDVCNIGSEVFVKAYSTYGYIYCVRERQGIYEMYYEENFTQNRALLSYLSNAVAAGNKELAMFLVLYHPDLGLEDSKGKAYNSSFYHGFFLGKMPGFVQVYPQDVSGFRLDIPIRVYKLLPLLELNNEEDVTVTRSGYPVDGRTEKGMRVKVNDQEVSLNQSYEFRKEVELKPGENTIKVESTDVQGYTTIKAFKVIYNMDNLVNIANSSVVGNGSMTTNNTNVSG
ncbi:hypothetical protein HY570_02790 [Candidatus Micrarchaeota archaeon]|nr:hypothetical protein [Candidatus Micrarchaeota archaeon]